MSNKKKNNGGIIWGFLGIVLAVLVSMLVIWYKNSPDEIASFTSGINFFQHSLESAFDFNYDLTVDAGDGQDTNDSIEIGAGTDSQKNPITDSEENEKKQNLATNNSNKVAEYDKNFYGQLKVIGTKLCDENNNPVQLKGVSTHGLNYYGQYVNEETIKWLKNDLGINVFRLAMYTAEDGGYLWNGDENKLKLESIVDTGVKACSENQMYVIIDWHILSDGNPNSNIDQSKQFFEKVSSKYNNYNNVIYEICNEPNGGTGWNDIKSYAEVIIPIIRKNDPDAVILVGTPNWCQDVDVVASNPLKYENVMYTCHFYAATHGKSYRDKVVRALKQGTPIFISEYGLVDAYGSGWVNTAEGDKWKDLIDENGISCCMWSLSNKAEGASIIRSDVSKLSGFTDNDLTDHGNWLKNTMLK